MLRIGHNISIAKGLITSAEYAETLNSNFYQIFLGSPQSYKKKRQTTADLERLKLELQNRDVMIVVHSSYLLNFCNSISSDKHTKAVKILVEDLDDSAKIGALGAILHMGKSLHMTKEEAVSNYIKGVESALDKSSGTSTVILETGAGQGTEICTDIVELGMMYRRFTKKHRKRIKFCIDTCHVYAAGYDLGNVDYVEYFWLLVDMCLGWKNVACVHLNDSKTMLNSRKDQHQDITKGFIQEAGMKHFVVKCKEAGVPIVLETPCGLISKREQISMVKEWCE